MTRTLALRHRPASEAIAEIEGLLTAWGTVELQPQRNALVVRDTEAVVRRVFARLRELLRFETFALVAEAGLEMREGERVAYQFGGDYRVEFELGVLTSNRQLRLGDFIVGRGSADEARQLIHTNLNLTLERPMVLGLAQTESSARALMVVLTCHLLPPAAGAGEGP